VSLFQHKTRARQNPNSPCRDDLEKEDGSGGFGRNGAAIARAASIAGLTMFPKKKKWHGFWGCQALLNKGRRAKKWLV